MKAFFKKALLACLMLSLAGTGRADEYPKLAVTGLLPSFDERLEATCKKLQESARRANNPSAHENVRLKYATVSKPKKGAWTPVILSCLGVFGACGLGTVFFFTLMRFARIKNRRLMLSQEQQNQQTCQSPRSSNQCSSSPEPEFDVLGEPRTPKREGDVFSPTPTVPASRFSSV